MLWGAFLDQRIFFNNMATKWDEICHHDEKILKSFMELLDIKTGQSVLDVGSGTGILLPYILEEIGKTGRICAVDYAEEMIKISRNKNVNSNIEFKSVDFYDIKPDIYRFDCIICYSMFPHVSDKEKAIAHFVSLLNNNGKLLICHSESRDDINKCHRESDKTVSEHILPPAVEISRIMETAGLEIIHEIDKEFYYILGHACQDML